LSALFEKRGVLRGIRSPRADRDFNLFDRSAIGHAPGLDAAAKVDGSNRQSIGGRTKGNVVEPSMEGQ
jgi:hypothetical protein